MTQNGKIKTGENKAEQVETKPNQDIENKPSEELALLLNQQYNILMQTQQNIRVINETLQKRLDDKPKE